MVGLRLKCISQINFTGAFSRLKRLADFSAKITQILKRKTINDNEPLQYPPLVFSYGEDKN